MLRRLIVIFPLFWNAAASGAEAEIAPVPPACPTTAILLEADPATLAATFDAVVYGRALTPAQLDALSGGVRSLQP